MSKQLPAILADLLSKLDVYGDDPILLANDDIPRTAERLVATLVKQGLFLPRIATHITCIKCEGQARVSRVGGRSKKALYASCGTCGSNFLCSEKDTREFQIDWNGLSGWLSTLMGFTDKPEEITGNVSFLGYHEHGTVRYEIHLMRGCAASTAKQDYQAIVQQMTESVIVLCLSRKPTLLRHKDASILHLSSFLTYDGKELGWQWPKGVFSGKDSVKQHAAHTRVANDPRQKCKERLEGFVSKNLHSLFFDQMHPAIYQMIEANHSEQLTYQDKAGHPQKLSKSMALDAIKSVLEAKGLSERISGRKTTDA